MSSVYIQWPPKEPPTFPNAAALPIPYLNGALAVALDTYTVYVFDGQTQTWLAIGGTTVPLSVGPLDGQPENANGASIAANQLFMQSADATHPGLVNNTTQSFSGNKTFTGTIAASNFSGSSSGTNTGDVTLSAFGSTPNANGLSLVGQVLNMQPADATHSGGLSSTDWNTFNNKQPAGSYISALTGDGTATGPGSVAFTLATVNGNVGSFGDASHSPSFTVNGKGLITAASSNSIQIAESQVTNLVSDLAGKQPAGNYITALTGDVTATGPGSSAATLATVNGNVGSFTYSSITVNAKGLITAASSGAAPVTTLSAVGASPNANAGTISGNTLNLQPFDSTHPGVVTASGGGTTNFLRADGTWATPTGSGSSIKVAYISDEKSSGTTGQTITSGSWNTRVLNTIVDPSSIVTSLSSNQFTLPTGTYLIDALAPGYQCDRYQAKLRDITNSADVIIGGSEYAQTTVANETTQSPVRGILTVSGSTVYEIQQQVATTNAGNGGNPANFGVVEVYTQILITKIA